MFVYFHSILVVVFVSLPTSIHLGCAVSAPLSAGGRQFSVPDFVKGGFIKKWVGWGN